MIAQAYTRNRVSKSEWWEIHTADGVRYPLETFGGRWVLAEIGSGMAPINYLTQQGPQQHGVTVVDYRLQPRVMELLLRQARCSRQQYWEARSSIIDHLRPNRSTNGLVTPARLRKILPDGSKWDLEVWHQDGLRFEAQSTDEWDRWAWQEGVRLFAPDPTWFNATEVETLFTLETQSQLVFPITFPITFGTGILSVSQSITYTGTWPTFPTIILQGPLNGPSITNLTIDENITLSYNISLGETVTINLTYGQKTVTNNLGVDLIGTVSSDSELATWRIEVDPRAPGGVNQIQVVGAGADPAETAVTLSYFIRKIGLGG